ncbi:hypothetical protein [Lapillicoccus sp.]|uniref:hypothetical protein n=1 Tax=Lapillicoccus sp. TaxID=1909287 RepID=UPI0025D45368|nr:hypothetical protein [Lapillicoccus sp.]
MTVVMIVPTFGSAKQAQEIGAVLAARGRGLQGRGGVAGLGHHVIVAGRDGMGR